jgi:autotransporter family porin
MGTLPRTLIKWEILSGNLRGHYTGLFVGYANLDADVKGEALGWYNVKTGKLNVDATSFGGYWTHIAPTGWYVDGVAMASWFGGDAHSSRDIGVDVKGTGVTLSLESGVPIPVTDTWSIEPQG